MGSPAQAMWDTSDSDRFAGDVIQLAILAAGLAMAYAKDDSTGMKMLGKTVVANAVATQGLKYAFNSTSWGKRPMVAPIRFPRAIPAVPVLARRSLASVMVGAMAHSP